MHNTLKIWGEREMQRAAGSGQQEQLVLFASEEQQHPEQDSLSEEILLGLWQKHFIVEGYDTKLEADFALERGKKMLRFFYEWWASESRSVYVIEKGFSIPSIPISHPNPGPDPTMISGRFDRIERTQEGLKIIDYKTSAPLSQDVVDADLQLSIYALACREEYGELPAELSLVFIREEGTSEVQTTRNESQLNDALKQINLISLDIEQGNFRPTPSKEICGKCPYKGVCDASAV